MDIASTAEGRQAQDTDRNGISEGASEENTASSHSNTAANGTPNVAEGENKFQRAIAAWRS